MSAVPAWGTSWEGDMLHVLLFSLLGNDHAQSIAERLRTRVAEDFAHVYGLLVLVLYL